MQPFIDDADVDAFLLGPIEELNTDEMLSLMIDLKGKQPDLEKEETSLSGMCDSFAEVTREVCTIKHALLLKRVKSTAQYLMTRSN